MNYRLFVYLGSSVNNQVDMDREINKGAMAFIKMIKIWNSKFS